MLPNQGPLKARFRSALPEDEEHTEDPLKKSTTANGETVGGLLASA